jgi:hypothetical protein
MTSNSFKQVIFGALASKGLRQQGATALVKQPKVKPRDESAETDCGCYVTTHQKASHPKYGNKVPYFDSKQVPDPNCRHRVAEAARLLAQTPVAAPAAPEPFEMDEHPLPADAYQCVATTKSGARCRNKTQQVNDRCGVHRK